MTQFEQLTLALDALKISYEVDYTVKGYYADRTDDERRETDVLIRIDEGMGYAGFHTEFYFREDGSFICHGAWE